MEDIKNEEVKQEVKTIDLSGLKNRTKIEINGEPDKFIELDLSDMGLVTRLNEEMPKLYSFADELGKVEINDDDPDIIVKKTAEQISKADSKMREVVNRIFDYDVCSVCVPTGTMIDSINGRFRFEILIDIIGELYNQNITAETKRIKARINQHTQKYVGRK